jgi:UDP-glucose 4-epimerase
MRPLSPYGVSKRAAEDYFLADAVATGLTVGVLRYGNAYGPRQAVSAECGVTTIFVQKILEGQSPTIYGDGSATRDYVYVSDVAEATVAALFSTRNLILNISSGEETSVQALWDQLICLSGKSIVACHGPERLGDITRSCLDPSLAWHELGWSATTSLQDGLKKTIEYYATLGCAEWC